MKNSLSYIGVLIVGVILGALSMLYVPGIQNLAENGNANVTKMRTGVSGAVDTKNARYTNKFYGFSILYPIDLTQKEFDEGNDAMTIVFQKPDEERGFQIFIVPFSGEQITQERIRSDLNGSPLNNAQEIILPGNIRAVHFESESATLGETSEVWFIHNGFLYEFTTYKPLDSMLAEVMQTLTFTN